MNFVKFTVTFDAGCTCVFKYESEKTPTVFSRGWSSVFLDLQSIVANHRLQEVPAAILGL